MYIFIVTGTRSNHIQLIVCTEQQADTQDSTDDATEITTVNNQTTVL